MMNLAIEWGWRTDNPARKIERYPEVARERFLSPEEAKRLADALHAHPNRDGVNATWLLLFTGSRKSEVLGAKWQEFDLERGVWTKPAHRTKQKKVEHFPLSNDALSILRAMRSAAPEDATWLFPGGDETRPYGGFKRFWRDLCKKAKLVGFRVHDCRHDFASTLVQQGYSLPAIGKLLGHTNPSTTNRYAHHNLDELRKVSDAAANRFTVIIGGKAKEETPLPLAVSA
jgi:integrase